MRQAWVLALLAAVMPAAAYAQDVMAESVPAPLQDVGVDERLGKYVDPSITLTDESGYPVPLSKFLNKGKPVLLTLAYYRCPMLCNLVLNGQASAQREIPWTPGVEYEAVTVSFDPAETFDLARQKKQLYLANFGRPAPGWHFLTDYQGNAAKLAEQVGFRYKYDEAMKQYAHAAVLIVLAPDGKISRYLYGIRHQPRDLRLALAEAGEFKVAFTVDRLLLYCYQYDPDARSYVPFAMKTMRLGGVLVVLVLGVVLWRLWRQERVSGGLVKT